MLTFTQMAHVLAIRSERDSLFRQGLFSNPGLLGAVALTVGLQFAILYVPALQAAFRTKRSRCRSWRSSLRRLSPIRRGRARETDSPPAPRTRRAHRLSLT